MAYPHTAVGVVAYYHKPVNAYARAANTPALTATGAPDAPPEQPEQPADAGFLTPESDQP